MIRKLFATAVLFSLAFSAWASAQDQNDGTLHVLRPLVHAEQDDAELCLELDHDLNPADRHRMAAAIRLESGGRAIPVIAQNVSIVSDLLCLSALEHRRDYRLIVTGLRGAKGEKLTSAYSLSFSIPDRQPSLAFAGEDDAGRLLRWQDNDPVLRALNVPHVSLELLRITTPDSLTEAWRERRQAALAPSESATFAHDHGEVVWNGDLAFESDPNKAGEEKIPLNAAMKSAAPGLYLIVAKAPETKSKGLAARGALWLLRSGLRIGSMRDAGGVYALAEKADGSGAVKDVHFTVEDANGQKLAEGKSDASGVAFLPLAGDKQNAAVVLEGSTDAGAVDFTEPGKDVNRFSLPENQATLSLDKLFYAPGDTASIALVSRDAGGRPVPEANTSLQLLWPDGSFYTSFPVSIDADGIARLSVPAPASHGNWSLVWKRSDGTVLTQIPIRVTSNRDAAHFETSTERAILSSGGELNLAVKSRTKDNLPMPYLAGHVLVAWTTPDYIFQELKDYHFSRGNSSASEAVAVASFVTNEKGEAFLHLTLSPPEDGTLLHAAVLRVAGSDAGDILGSVPLTLPVRPKETIVGIKPLAPEGRFPENGVARFNVIALDAEGHRQSASDLTYQIYEEGRNFEWHQSEGRWDYKPLQQTRRIGGDALNLSGEHDNIIEWPVTAGNYRLEITDANGAVETSTGFSAGWGAGGAAPPPLSLPLTAPTVLHPGQAAQIRFVLDSSSMASVFIGDDRIRKVIHQLMPKGENIIAFVPEKDWGGRINIHVATGDFSRMGQLTLPLLAVGQNNPEMAVPKQNVPTEIFSVIPRVPSVLKVGDSTRLGLELKNNGKVSGTYRLTLSAFAGVKVFGFNEGAATLPSGQTKNVSFTLNAAHAGVATVKLDIAAPPHFHESREWPIAIQDDETALVPVALQKIERRQAWTASSEKNRGKNGDGIFFLASQPLFNAPLFLSNIMTSHPFTTDEIADVMETMRLWHGAIVASGLQSEAGLEIERQNLLLRLLARQKPDGGFSPLPADPADFRSTSAALGALAHIDFTLAKPATELAAGWLRHRLENTWFDEKERPERAGAYAALAEADRLDSASLHYFGDTSADKALPQLAAAQLAFAFTVSGDQSKAVFWLDASGAQKKPSELSLPLLPLLASNGFFDPQALMPAMQKAADVLAKEHSRDIESLAYLLRATEAIQQRNGSWRVDVNSDKRNPKNTLVFSEKNISTIHNTGDNPLFLIRARPAGSAPAGPVTRHIYQLNGVETDAMLTPGKTYLITLEGPWPAKDSNSASIHDDATPGLQSLECLPPAPIEGDEALAWLKSQSFTPRTACETWNGGIDVMMRKDRGGGAWRVAYLAKAGEGGSFTLAPPVVRNTEGNQESMEGSKSRLEIR